MEKENGKHTEENSKECNRCHQLQTEFSCDECYKGNYCSNCDKYMHSLSSKKNHKRRMITEQNEKYPSQVSSEIINDICEIKTPPNHQLTTDQYCSSYPRTKTVSQSYLNEIKQIYTKEKEELVATISLLHKRLDEADKTFNERIDFLHNYIENIEQKHINDTVINEKKWNKQLDEIVIEKENQTEFLYEKIHRLEGIINEKSNKINEYEDLLNTSTSNYKNQLALAHTHLEEVIKENTTIKEFYAKRLDDLIKSTEEEKTKLVATYEKSIEQLKEGYQASKDNHLLIIQQRDNELREMIINNQKDRNELGERIDQLNESNENSIKEKEDLIKMVDILKKALNDANESLDKQKKELKSQRKEKKDLINELAQLKSDYEELETKNEKVNQLMFGRFKQKKCQNEA